MTKLIVAIRNFANSPNDRLVFHLHAIGIHNVQLTQIIADGF